MRGMPTIAMQQTATIVFKSEHNKFYIRSCGISVVCKGTCYHSGHMLSCYHSA